MNALLPKGEINSEWTGGFWEERWNFCRDKMVPHMWSILDNREVSHCWENFQLAVGESDNEGGHSGPPFWDGDLFKWLEAAIRVYANSDNEEWLKRLDYIIDTIAKVQRDDGYIFTMEAIERARTGETNPLEDINNFEVFNMGHLMSAGVIHYRMTGQTKLLDLAKKAAGWLKTQFDNLEEATPRTAVCPSHYMGLAELYQATADEQYLNLLEKLILLRDMVPDGTDDNQDRHPLKEHREILGHGVRATYLYAGLTDLYLGKGDEDYRAVLEAVWQDMVSKKTYITGGCAPLYDGVSPYGGDDYDAIQRTHQSFGRAYELPNINGYNETCASIGSYLWAYRMVNAFQHGKYADQMERALYNSTISGINLDGDKYFYTNALRCVHDHDLPYDLKWSRHREDFLSSFCCPPNVVRTIAETQDKAAVVWENGIAFLMYGDSRTAVTLADGGKVTMKVSSDYPWHGDIAFEIESIDADAPFSVYLRIPGWAESYQVQINGQPATHLEQAHNGFIEINRQWQAGDKIALSLPMEVILNECHNLVEENRNHLAITRGPLVYCLESADIPEGCSVADLHIDPNSAFSFEKSRISGVDLGVLKGTLYTRNPRNDSPEVLYKKYQAPTFKQVDVTLVPYFAWDNRDKGEMTVWLPILPVQN